MSTRTLPKTPQRPKKVAKATGAPRKKKLTEQQRRQKYDDNESLDSEDVTETTLEVYRDVTSSGGSGALLSLAEVRDVIEKYRNVVGLD